MSVQLSSRAVLDLIRKWAADHELEVPSDTNRSFAEAGFDSLHAVELTFFLEEQLGIPVDETAIWEKATFGAFAQYLVDRSGVGKADGAQHHADNRPIADSGDW